MPRAAFHGLLMLFGTTALAVFILLMMIGCAPLAAGVQASAQQADPVMMCKLSTCEAFIVQAGAPIPIWQRLKEVDHLCSPLCEPAK